jgi:hypothetical protein
LLLGNVAVYIDACILHTKLFLSCYLTSPLVGLEY